MNWKTDCEKGKDYMYRCIVWDWNGTLLNDVQAAFSAMNAMLSRRGLPLMESLAQYRELFTFPVRQYYAAAGLDLEREAFEDLAAEWTGAYYRAYPACGLYPGVRDILRSLAEQGARQIIVSASQQQALESQVAGHGVGECFAALLGISDIYAGSKSGLARRYFQKHGISPEQALFVGDTLHDWEVAQEAGCPCVLLAQGHQSRTRLEQAGVPVADSLELVWRWISFEKT